MPASALGLRRVADRSPRKPVEIMAAGRPTRPCWPFSVLHEGGHRGGRVGYHPLARADPREVRVTRFLFGMKPAPRLTDMEGHTR
jgi:hypothetical protein